MTCAEFVAHRWGVRWQMIVADGNGGSVNGNLGGSNSGGGGGSSRGGSIAQPSLFASAGGLEKGGHWPAPEGVVRLSTVDIARVGAGDQERGLAALSTSPYLPYHRELFNAVIIQEPRCRFCFISLCGKLSGHVLLGEDEWFFDDTT